MQLRHFLELPGIAASILHEQYRHNTSLSGCALSSPPSSACSRCRAQLAIHRSASRRRPRDGLVGDPSLISRSFLPQRIPRAIHSFLGSLRRPFPSGPDQRARFASHTPQLDNCPPEEEPGIALREPATRGAERCGRAIKCDDDRRARLRKRTPPLRRHRPMAQLSTRAAA